MNLIFYQKVDLTDPRSCSASSRNGAYAERRKLRFFKYSGDDVFGTVLQEMKVDEECEGAIVLFEHERLTVDGLEKKIDGLSFVKNDAAFYVFPKLDVKKFNITNDKQFAHDLLDVTNILLVPGSGFDWKDPDHFRIVMLPQADILSDAIRRMGTFLDGYKQK